MFTKDLPAFPSGIRTVRFLNEAPPPIDDGPYDDDGDGDDYSGGAPVLPLFIGVVFLLVFFPMVILTMVQQAHKVRVPVHYCVGHSGIAGRAGPYGRIVTCADGTAEYEEGDTRLVEKNSHIQSIVNPTEDVPLGTRSGPKNARY